MPGAKGWTFTLNNPADCEHYDRDSGYIDPGYAIEHGVQSMVMQREIGKQGMSSLYNDHCL